MQLDVLVLIIPICTAILCIAGSYILSCRKIEMKKIKDFDFIKLSGIKYCIAVFGLIALGQIMFFFIVTKLLYIYYAGSDGSIPPAVISLVCFCCSVLAFVRLWADRIRLCSLVYRCAVLSIVVLVAEIVIFNGKSFNRNYEKYILSADNIEIETSSAAAFSEDGGITITDDAVLVLRNLPEFTRVIAIDARQPDYTPAFRTELKMCDGNFINFHQTVSNKLVGGHGSPSEFSLLPYGEIRSLQLVFSDLKSTVTLHSVTAMNCIPFRFSLIRYMALFVSLASVFAIKIFGLAKIVYDRANIRHKIAVIVMVIACMSSSLLFYVPDQKLIEYPLQNDVAGYDPYTQTFDAFMKGQVWLDVIPDRNLETLENVYDSDIRLKSGFSYLWDRAYFKQKYYSYFGVAPVFILYYPVYFLTGKLPPLAMANGIFGMLSILFLCLAVLAAVRLFVKRANLLLLLLAMAAATCLSGAYYCFEVPDMYDVVVASAGCFLFLSVWAGIRACFTQNKAVRLALLTVCGISLGLCAGSRPSVAMGGLVLAPLFLAILFDGSVKLKFRLAQAAAFLVPVFAAAAGLMWYNYLRFGSLMDFGANYQITMSDIHANHLRLSALFPAMVHYFLQPVRTSDLFPFFNIFAFHMRNYGMYCYSDMMIGAFWFPMLSMGFFLIPKSMKMGGNGLAKFRKRGFIIACFVMAAGIAWMDFCLAGLNLRYLIDIMPPLILGSVCTILGTTADPKRTQYKFAIASTLISIIFIFMIMIARNDWTLTLYHQNLYETLEDLVIFWQ